MVDQYGGITPKELISFPPWSELVSDLKLFTAVMECRWYTRNGEIYITPGALKAHGVSDEWVDNQRIWRFKDAMLVPETMKKRMMPK